MPTDEKNATGAATEAPAPPSVITECPACGAAVEPSDHHCHACGWRLAENRALDITDEELEDYLFKGYVQREFTHFKGKIRYVIRTLQTGDYNKVQRHMGDYVGNRRTVSADIQNESRLVTMAHSLVSWMGKPVQTIEESRDHLEAQGEGIFELMQDRFNALVLGVSKEIAKESRVGNS